MSPTFVSGSHCKGHTIKNTAYIPIVFVALFSVSTKQFHSSWFGLNISLFSCLNVFYFRSSSVSLCIGLVQAHYEISQTNIAGPTFRTHSILLLVLSPVHSCLLEVVFFSCSIQGWREPRVPQPGCRELLWKGWEHLRRLGFLKST